MIARFHKNPVDGKAHVAINIPSEREFRLRVIDMQCRAIYEDSRYITEGHRNLALPMTNASQGVSLIRIEAQNVDQIAKKFVKD